MLECFHEFEKGFAVGRKRMGNLAASIFFIQETRLNKGLRVLGNGFEICIQLIRNLLNRNPVISFNNK